MWSHLLQWSMVSFSGNIHICIAYSGGRLVFISGGEDHIEEYDTQTATQEEDKADITEEASMEAFEDDFTADDLAAMETSMEEQKPK